MSLQNKIIQLIQIGIPIKTIAKYANYNETYISKFAKGQVKVSDKFITMAATGLNQLLKDIEAIINER